MFTDDDADAAVSGSDGLEQAIAASLEEASSVEAARARLHTNLARWGYQATTTSICIYLVKAVVS